MTRPKKTKIVLDADIIIHFIKGNCFSLLVEIFPEYECIVLDKVYNELSKVKETKTMIDNYVWFIKKLTIIRFAPTGDSLREYAHLRRTKGEGESASMIYCKDNKDVLGSSNLKDIKDFCTQYNITYLTTLDFLYYAWIRKKMTAKECTQFIDGVNRKGSIIPGIDITTYSCKVGL
jgi:hypothetical protein